MALLAAAGPRCLLLLADLALLPALARLAPPLAHLGPAATWLEAALRLAAFLAVGRLLAPRRHRAAALVLSLAPAAFLTLRTLLAPHGAAPLTLATAAPTWLALSHAAAAAAAALAWATPASAAGSSAPVAVGRLLAVARSEWPVLGAAFLFLALATAGEMAGPYCTGKALDAIRRGEGVTASALALLLAADLGSSLFAGCRAGLFTLAYARLKFGVCHRVFSRLVRQDLPFFQGTPADELVARLAREVPWLCQAVPWSANMAVRSAVAALGLVVAMAGLAPRLTLLALLEAPLVIAMRRAYDRRYQALERAALDAGAGTAAAVREAVASIQTVRTFAGEEEEERRHDRALAETLRLKERLDVEQALLTLLQRALQLAVRLLVLHRGHQQLREGTVTAGDLVTFLLYQAKVGRHVEVLVFGHGDLVSKAAAGRQILEYWDLEPTDDTGGTRAPATLRGHVVFRRVSFAYPARPERLVLRDVSFELRPGEVTALMGPNGSGKSTCAALLARLYAPGEGAVLLDDVPLCQYRHRYLRRQVVLVEQEPVLFSGTIRENIALGLEDCEEEEVIAAADAAGALPFISALERGFDTDVGDRGQRLSAAEKQRVAVARALLRRPTVLILDEAAGVLEEDGAAALRRWARREGTATVLLVTHRRRLLEAADRVVALARGGVAWTGTPAQLRGRRGAGRGAAPAGTESSGK